MRQVREPRPPSRMVAEAGTPAPSLADRSVDRSADGSRPGPAGGRGPGSADGVVAAGYRLPSRRRDPYPVSPVIGPEGARACAEIMAAARDLFARRGFHGTSVQAVAAATGRSDTAFYQYFQSKIELFTIFYEELGRDLVRHFQQQPALVAGADGLAEFRCWLDGLGAILRRHSPVFARWPLVAEDDQGGQDPSEGYLRVLADEMRQRLASAGPGPGAGSVDTRVLATAIIGLVQWSHVILDTRRVDATDPPGGIETHLHGTLAQIIHESLFPPEQAPAVRTEQDAAGPPAAAGLPGAATSPGRAVPWPPLLRADPADAGDPAGPAARPEARFRVTQSEPVGSAASAADAGEPTGLADPAGPGGGPGRPALVGLRRPVTRRAAVTIDRILDAATRAFERRGLTGTSVNDIVAEAGIAHGTYYQYWTDRNAVFATLAHRAAVETCERLDGLLAARTPDEVLDWLDRWLDLVARHGATYHSWTVEVGEVPALWPLARQLRDYLEEVTAVLCARWAPDRGLDRAAATIALWALLVEFPYHAWRRHPVLDREEVRRSQALLFAGGLLGVRTAPRGPSRSSVGAVTVRKAGF